MFKRKVQPLDDVLMSLLRQQGLETPLLQRRAVEVWDAVVGKAASRCTKEKFIKDQTLFVKISNPALRQDLSMMRQQLVRRVNAAVGTAVVSDVRVY